MNDEKIKDFEYMGVPGATNNQMELRGCIGGLKEARAFSGLASINRIIVFTDSMYVSENYMLARSHWPKNHWVGRDGPIQNVDLWKELDREFSKLRKNASIKWVKGHTKNIHNKAVDAMAKKAAQNCIGNPVNVVTVRRRKFKNDAEHGKIKHCGQKFTIKIFTCEYLKQHGLYKYKYEVVSKKSSYYKYSGITYFSEPLRTRYSYLVTLTNSENDCRISTIHRVYGKLKS
jgi:ribonuclease HI